MGLDRRGFVRSLVASMATPAVASVLSEAQPHAPSAVHAARRQKKPNVVLMICDDLGYGDLHCYGSNLATPNVDALAAQGQRSMRHNSAHPICSASRAALLTGRYGHRMETTGAFTPGLPGGTSLDETMLSNLFKNSGYKTHAVGKWHLGDAVRHLPTHRGFDSFFGVPFSVDNYPLALMRDETVLEEDTDRATLTPRYTDEAVKCIEKSNGAPFFLYLAFSYPHDPPMGSPPFHGKSGFGDQGDAIEEIDWSAGEVIKALDRKGLTSDTIVIFTSDHGPWYQGNPGPLRGRKCSTFEGGFRVPFLVKWPGTLPAGKVQDAWCSHLDILPTLAAICGLSLPEKPLDGINVESVWFGHRTTPERKPLLYFGAIGNHGVDIHCIRKEQWKLRIAQGFKGEIYVNDPSTGARQSAWLRAPELYNVEQDAAESYNVAPLHPEIVSELMASLEEQMQTFPPNVVEAYAKLKEQRGDISTPPGASPRPDHEPCRPFDDRCHVKGAV